MNQIPTPARQTMEDPDITLPTRPARFPPAADFRAAPILVSPRSNDTNKQQGRRRQQALAFSLVSQYILRPELDHP
jgi:hypothetical protein